MIIDSKREMKEIADHIYLIIYNDQSITIGDKNNIKDSTIASKISDGLKKVRKD